MTCLLMMKQDTMVPPALLPQDSLYTIIKEQEQPLNDANWKLGYGQ